MALGTYTLNLIAYTNDPGFFVQFKADDPTVPPSGRFYPVLGRFESDFGVERDKLEVLDIETFQRWITDDEQYRSALRHKS